MKTRVYIIALVSLVSVLVNAQTSWTAPINEQPMVQSHQLIQTGTTYEGTVYEPFDNTIPSDQSEVAKCTSPKNSTIKRFGNFDDVPEGGTQENSYPIGDAMWPLMLLVGAYCGVMIFRRKRALRE